VGAHGGLGGMQTQPFLIYPSAWTDEPPELVGSVDVHHFLMKHTRAADTTPDDSKAEDASECQQASREEPAREQARQEQESHE
jgi:hypothetical protein